MRRVGRARLGLLLLLVGARARRAHGGRAAALPLVCARRAPAARAGSARLPRVCAPLVVVVAVAVAVVVAVAGFVLVGVVVVVGGGGGGGERLVFGGSALERAARRARARAPLGGSASGQVRVAGEEEARPARVAVHLRRGIASEVHQTISQKQVMTGQNCPVGSESG